MLKDIIFSLELAAKVLGTFIIMTYVGMKLSEYFNNKICILFCLILAFLNVMRLLLGVGKHE